MDARTISLLRDSVAKLIHITEQADVLFNARLLDTFPEVYRIFAMDAEPEEQSFVAMLSLAVDRVHRCGAILSTVWELVGERKVFRMVQDHYGAIGSATMSGSRPSASASVDASENSLPSWPSRIFSGRRGTTSSNSSNSTSVIPNRCRSAPQPSSATI